MRRRPLILSHPHRALASPPSFADRIAQACPSLSVAQLAGRALAQAQIAAACRDNPEIGRNLSTVNPLVLECNDGCLNDIQSMAPGCEHDQAALACAGPDFAQGSVGAGRGMSTLGVKGGIVLAVSTAHPVSHDPREPMPAATASV